MKIAKAELDALENLAANECPVVFKWTSQSQTAKHVYLTVFLLLKDLLRIRVFLF